MAADERWRVSCAVRLRMVDPVFMESGEEEVDMEEMGT